MFVNKITKIIILFLLTLAPYSYATFKPNPLVDNDSAALVALMVPLSGRFEKTGKDLMNGAKLALSKNKNSNIKLEIINTAATKFDPKLAIEALRQRKIKLILTSVDFHETLRIALVARDAKIPVISFSNNSNLTKYGVMIFGITPESQVNKLVSQAQKEGTLEFYALLQGDKIGRGRYKDVIINAVKKCNPSAAINIYFYGDKDEMKENLFKITKEMSVNLNVRKALIFTEGGEELEQFSKMINLPNNLKGKVKIYGFNSWDDKNTLSNNKLDGAMFIKIKSPKFNHFEKEFYKSWGYKPPYNAVLAYGCSKFSFKT